jgi:hypothetical protein
VAHDSTHEKQQAHELIERLAPSQVSAVVGMLEAMLDPVSRAIANPPVDDEPVSEGKSHPASGSSTTRASLTKEVLGDFGLTPRRLEEEPEKPRVRKIAWSESARADIRRLDRDTAMRIFAALHRFAETGEGDIKEAQGRVRRVAPSRGRLPRALHR